MTRRGDHAPTQRQLRVGEELRHALAWALERGDLRDPALAHTPVTVTEVRVSPDLRNATAFIVPLGGGDAGEVLAALRRARAYLRKRVADNVQLKYVPDLGFQEDDSFDAASRIDELLHDPRVAQDLDHGEDDDGA